MERTREESRIGFGSLPEEVTLMIFAKLNGNDLLQCDLVCQAWRAFATDKSLLASRSERQLLKKEIRDLHGNSTANLFQMCCIVRPNISAKVICDSLLNTRSLPFPNYGQARDEYKNSSQPIDLPIMFHLRLANELSRFTFFGCTAGVFLSSLVCPTEDQKFPSFISGSFLQCFAITTFGLSCSGLGAIAYLQWRADAPRRRAEAIANMLESEEYPRNGEDWQGTDDRHFGIPTLRMILGIDNCRLFLNTSVEEIGSFRLWSRRDVEKALFLQMLYDAHKQLIARHELANEGDLGESAKRLLKNNLVKWSEEFDFATFYHKPISCTLF